MSDYRECYSRDFCDERAQKLSVAEAEVERLREVNRILINERNDLRAFIDGIQKHVEAAATMYGLTRR